MYTFYIKAAGVTFNGRQEIVKKLSVGDQLFLIAEPGNPYDINAVRIETTSGTQVGYVPKGNNSQISLNLRNHNGRYSAHVSSVTGEAYGTYGVNIEITYYE